MKAGSEVVRINNPHGECFVCEKSLSGRTVLVNDDESVWVHLPPNEKAHFECYLDHCVKIAHSKYRHKQ